MMAFNYIQRQTLRSTFERGFQGLPKTAADAMVLSIFKTLDALLDFFSVTIQGRVKGSKTPKKKAVALSRRYFFC